MRLEPVSRSEVAFKNKDDCSICLVEYNDCDSVIILPCNPRHNFHANCIKEWLRNRNVCPICRAPVTEATLEDYSAEKMVELLKESESH